MGDMYRERERLSPALGEGGNGDGGGAAGRRRNAEYTQRGPRNALGGLAAWGGKERGILGWGRRGTRTGESCGEARASRAGMARAECERERGATRYGCAGAA